MNSLLKKLSLVIFSITILSCNNQSQNELKTTVSVAGLETKNQFTESIKKEIQSQYKCRASLTGSINFKTSNSLNTLSIKIDSVGLDSTDINLIASEVSLSIFEKIRKSKFKDTYKNLDVEVNKGEHWSLGYELNNNKYNQIKNQIKTGETFLKNWKEGNFLKNAELFHDIIPVDTVMQVLPDTLENINSRNGKIKNQKFIAYYTKPGTLEEKAVEFVYVVFQLDFEKKKDFIRLIFPMEGIEIEPKIIGTEGVI